MIATEHRIAMFGSPCGASATPEIHLSLLKVQGRAVDRSREYFVHPPPSCVGPVLLVDLRCKFLISHAPWIGDRPE